MSDIAIVKLVKDIFKNVFGAEEKKEKVSLVNTAEPESLSSDTDKKETTAKAKKKPAKKKESTTEKKSVSKKKTTPEKKKTGTSKTKKAAPKGSKKAEKLALYSKALKKHYGEVDDTFLEIIVKNLGPSIYRKDAELVSCSDPKELDTVRKNFLMKKLQLEDDRKILDAAIKEVCEELKGASKKYRAIFYYRLAQKFKKESVLS